MYAVKRGIAKEKIVSPTGIEPGSYYFPALDATAELFNC
jgi:hypothetical protein